MVVKKSSILTRDLQTLGFSGSILLVVVNWGRGNPPLWIPLMLLLKTMLCPFLPGHMSTKQTLLISAGGWCWDQLRRESCLGMPCLLPRLCCNIIKQLRIKHQYKGLIWFINTNESLGDSDVGTGGIPLSWVRHCRHVLTCRKYLDSLTQIYKHKRTHWVVVEFQRKKEISSCYKLECIRRVIS